VLGGESHRNGRRVNKAETDQHRAEPVTGAVLLQESLDELLLGQQPSLDEQPAERNRPRRAGALLVRERVHAHNYRPKTSATASPGIPQNV
jgi:hypothetical protein